MRRERLEIWGKDRKKGERVRGGEADGLRGTRLRMLSRLFCAGFPLARTLALFPLAFFFQLSFFFSVRLTACWVRNVEHKKPLAEKMEKKEKIESTRIDKNYLQQSKKWVSNREKKRLRFSLPIVLMHLTGPFFQEL